MSAAPGRDPDLSRDQVVLGIVVGVHGVKGAVKIKSFTAEPLDIGAYGALIDQQGRSHSLTVLHAAKEVVVARIEGVDDRTAAERLKGLRLSALRSQLPEPADEDEFYHHDLIGLAVESVAGTPLGTVVGIHNFGAGDVVEINRPGGLPELFLPFSRAVVPIVDLKDRRIVVDPPAETEPAP